MDEVQGKELPRDENGVLVGITEGDHVGAEGDHSPEGGSTAPRKQPERVRSVSVRFTKKEFEALTRHAQERGITRSELLRESATRAPENYTAALAKAARHAAMRSRYSPEEQQVLMDYENANLKAVHDLTVAVNRVGSLVDHLLYHANVGVVVMPHAIDPLQEWFNDLRDRTDAVRARLTETRKEILYGAGFGPRGRSWGSMMSAIKVGESTDEDESWGH